MRRTATAAQVNNGRALARLHVTRPMRYIAVLRALPDRRGPGYGLWMLHLHTRRHLNLIAYGDGDHSRTGLDDNEQATREVVKALVRRGYAENVGSHGMSSYRITRRGHWLEKLLTEAREERRE